jgi:Bacterial pre-peptidase C-terminal domain
MNPIARAAAPLAVCLLTALAAGTAHAQPGVTPIRVGQTVNGTIDASGEPVLDRGRFHAYSLTANEGDRLIVSATSTEFDTYLIVGRSVGPVLDPLEEDDDGGEDTNSRVRFVAPRAGTYVVLVQAYREDGAGPFTLSVQQAPQPTTGQEQATRIGATEEGTLAETDNFDEEDDRYYDSYTFTGRAGQRVQIDMASEFDTYLSLGRLDGCDWEELASDDDGSPDGTNSRIRFTLPEDGRYVVRATSYGEGMGAYTLALTERAAPAQPTAQPLGAGRDVQGSLDDDDAVLETDGSFYDLWSYQGHAGEQLRLNMMSSDFDTYLAIGRMRGGDFEEIATMDDGGEGTNTLLEVTLPDDGEYVIRANSFRADQTGDYTLRLDSSRDQ